MSVKPFNWLILKRQMRRLQSYGWFDSAWYLSRNPDVREAGVNPLEHYLKFGADEGRDPHPGFISKWYTETYADSIKTGCNPLLHYCLKGRELGFQPHPALKTIESWKSLEKTSVANLHDKPDLKSRLVIGFAVTDQGHGTTAGDFFSARELGLALNAAFGWEIRFLSKSDLKNCWYDVSALDCLVVMLDEYDLQRIYGAHQNLVTIAWMRNWFERWTARPWFGDFHIHLCTSEISRKYLKSVAGVDASILRLATNSNRFNRLIEPNSAYISDYCFTGNYWGSEREIEKLVPGTIEHDFALYGSGWENHDNFKLHWRGIVKYDEINHVYASSKLVIDDADDATRRWGSVNSRVFDALATGTLVITNGETGAREVFGNLLPTSGSAEELQSNIDYLLNHTQERKLMTDKLHDIVHSQHTYEIRAQELFGIIRKLVVTEEKCVALEKQHDSGAVKK